MIEGITLLNTFTTAIATGWTTLFIILAVVCTLITIAGTDCDTPFVSICSLIVVIASLCCAVLGIGAKEVTRYQVLIDSSVSYAELTEHYEVIKQEGLIYTIQEK